jgi:protein SCO1
MNEDKDMAKPSRRGPSGGGFNGPLVALAVVALAVVALLAGRTYWGPGHVVAPAEGQETTGGPFTLIDQDGHTVTDKDFQGKWLLVYFGYTFCPDVCPTALTRNASVIDLLGDKGDNVIPVLITVDPGRDKPEKLKDYVHYFHPRTVGLTGTSEQIAAVAREYKVYYGKSGQKDDGSYVVDHSSLTYLVGPDGRFVQVFGHQTSPEEMAERIRKLL